MSDDSVGFIEKQANNRSISKRKMVFGIGVNDANYLTNIEVNGNKMMCPFYKTWVNMLSRCFNDKYQDTRPTYKGCTVAHEWLKFSAFKNWMIKQDWKGKSLDKDIIKPKNKHYSPETCVFVSKELNSLLTDSKGKRGEYPQGVSYRKQNRKFEASCRVEGKKKHLGFFDNVDEAHKAYNNFKSEYIAEIAAHQLDKKIKRGLIAHAENLSKECQSYAS